MSTRTFACHFHAEPCTLSTRTRSRGVASATSLITLAYTHCHNCSCGVASATSPIALACACVHSFHNCSCCPRGHVTDRIHSRLRAFTFTIVLAACVPPPVCVTRDTRQRQPAYAAHITCLWDGFGLEFLGGVLNNVIWTFHMVLSRSVHFHLSTYFNFHLHLPAYFVYPVIPPVVLL
jgi:hypothetical protein